MVSERHELTEGKNNFPLKCIVWKYFSHITSQVAT